MEDWQISNLAKGDYRFLIETQRTEYLRLKEQGQGIIRSIISIISIAGSLGALQYILSDGIDSTVLEIPQQVTNSCAPEGLSFGTVYLPGVGTASSYIAISIGVLVLALILEILLCNRWLQSLDRLQPMCESELLSQPLNEILSENQNKLDDAESFVDSIKSKRATAAVLTMVSGVLFLLVLFDQPVMLLVADVALLITGLALIAKWFVGLMTIPALELDELFANSTRVSPVFLGLVSIVWIFALRELWPIFKHLNKYLIC